MHGAHELCPGIYETEVAVVLCPGCGLKDLGVVDPTPENVLDWCLAACEVLRERGVEAATEAAARECAESYIRSPWHAN